MQLPLEITFRLVRMIQVWVESGQTPRCSFPCICATTSIMYHLFIGSNVGSDGVLSMSFLFSRDNIPGGKRRSFPLFLLSMRMQCRDRGGMIYNTCPSWEQQCAPNADGRMLYRSDLPLFDISASLEINQFLRTIQIFKEKSLTCSMS